MLVNIFVFVFGAIIGSFLNVCIYRLPRNQSIIFPASHCPNCDHPIAWYDNIPILSYLLLRGKCRSCKQSISLRYPLIELLNGILYLMIVSCLGFSVYGLGFYFTAYFISALIVTAFSDLETGLIPDQPIFLGIILGLIYGALIGKPLDPLLGAALGFSALFAVQKLGAFIYKKDVLGDGDLKLAAFLGAFLYAPNLFLGLFLGYLIGAVVASLLLAFKVKKLGDYIPFGPYLALGGLAALFFGPQIIDLYVIIFLGLR
ncbi:prepilin peptidase [Candidatus Saganbacteria bacterium]|nr:prepilin peptidase [Candidatus Saganbacteria bacterium]